MSRRGTLYLKQNVRTPPEAPLPCWSLAPTSARLLEKKGIGGPEKQLIRLL
jgi:hypothetical protein